VICAAGCQQEDLSRQPRYDTFQPSELFPDGTSARPLLRGTVARGQLRPADPFFTGMEVKNGKEELVREFPVKATRGFVLRGQERFGIYCMPCHGPQGDGNGRVVERGYVRPPSYHIDRLREAPVGHFFDVMTRGYGAMPDYSAEVDLEDRWAIAAYIRVLQASEHFPEKNLTDVERGRLPARKGGAR
jgi:mono/diheme cytochrome c family protein